MKKKNAKSKKKERESKKQKNAMGLQPPPKKATVADLIRLVIPPVWVASLPSLVINVSRDGDINIIAGLLHVQQSVVIIRDFAGRHEASDFTLSQLLFLALDGPRR